MLNAEVQALKKEFRQIITIIGGSLAILWSVWIASVILVPLHLADHGIHPRTVSGLEGIIFAPFLHASFMHILGNSIVFVPFATLILMQDISSFFTVTIITALISGLGTWLIGSPNTNHIGASGVIFGYFGYCISIGFFKKKVSTILFSLIIIITYGSMIFGILPAQIGISWEEHLFGLIGGIFSAFLLSKNAFVTRLHAPATIFPKDH